MESTGHQCTEDWNVLGIDANEGTYERFPRANNNDSKMCGVCKAIAAIGVMSAFNTALGIFRQVCEAWHPNPATIGLLSYL